MLSRRLPLLLKSKKRRDEVDMKRQYASVATLGVYLAFLFATTLTQAATDGELSPSASTGKLEVRLVINGSVHVPALQDIIFEDVKGTEFGLIRTCIRASHSTRLYAVTAHSANAKGIEFVATDGNRKLPYSATWNNIKLQPGVRLAELPAANPDDPNCTKAGGSNAAFSVNFEDAFLEEVPIGAYIDKVTLLIEPS